jgi:hypothetical protein
VAAAGSVVCMWQRTDSGSQAQQLGWGGQSGGMGFLYQHSATAAVCLRINIFHTCAGSCSCCQPVYQMLQRVRLTGSTNVRILQPAVHRWLT